MPNTPDITLVPLLSPSVKPDRMEVALPDGLLAFRPTTAAPAVFMKVVLEGEALEAIIKIEHARLLRDAISAILDAAEAEAAAAPEATR